MAENVTIARPYADAAFQMAHSDGALDAWSGALERLAAIAADPAMRECFARPNLSAADRARLVTDVASDADATLTAEQGNFIALLAENNRLALLPEIRQLFDDLKDAHEGIREAAIDSAFPLDDATTAALVSDLERKFGCRIQARVTVDPELIGGVKIALGDQVIDASVRGKLAAMALAIKK
ncbi:MAG: F0F1 ATP synthase subunit delta [Betaproteobacteria bacterium]|nr:F0F1 ATP synthase subunit delta [Betaproteobacteria bacterium]